MWPSRARYSHHAAFGADPLTVQAPHRRIVDVFDGDREVGRIYRLDDRPDSAWFWGVSFELTGRSKGPRTKSLEPRISLAASP
jgi:hypothetical protein